MDDGIEPRRTHDELMQIVVARGEALRSRRRRAMSLGAGGVVLLIALVAGVTTASHRAAETRVSAAGSGTPTTPTLSPLPFAGSGPHAPFDFPLPPFVSPVTTAAGGAPTTVVPPVASPSGEPATTIAAVASTPTPNTPAAATTTTTRPPPPLHECARDQLVVDATTDKALYLTGEKVMLTSTARNRSGVACGYSGYSFESVFTDGNGKALTLKSALMSDNFRLEPLSPGQVLTQTREWDQQACTYADDGTATCSAAAPGTYKASVRWSLPGGPYEATADFGLARLPVTAFN